MHTMWWIGRAAVMVAVMAAGAGCASERAGVVYQNGTIDALLDGNYDGETTFAELGRRGDFGVGTFNRLDGEMVAVDGRFYQAAPDGRVREVPGEWKTPFSAVTFFRPEVREAVAGPMEYGVLQAKLDGMRSGQGRAFAVRVTGRFSVVKVRSVPRQEPPYRRLAEVVKEQSVFEFKEVSGTLVGFWFPESLRHVNVPGYHFHFVSADRKSGGHVLGLTLQEGVAEVQELKAVEMGLGRAAVRVLGAGERGKELEAVEK